MVTEATGLEPVGKIETGELTPAPELEDPWLRH